MHMVLWCREKIPPLQYTGKNVNGFDNFKSLACFSLKTISDLLNDRANMLSKLVTSGGILLPQYLPITPPLVKCEFMYFVIKLYIKGYKQNMSFTYLFRISDTTIFPSNILAHFRCVNVKLVSCVYVRLR